MIGEYETRLEIVGEEMPAIIEYEIDGEGPSGILICSISLRRCVAQRGDVVYHQDGDCHLANFPEYITLEITQFLKGSQIKSLAEEVYESIKENNWDEVMNEPCQYVPRNFPDNFPGVRL